MSLNISYAGHIVSVTACLIMLVYIYICYLCLISKIWSLSYINTPNLPFPIMENKSWLSASYF